jgi:hypothetical protein
VKNCTLQMIERTTFASGAHKTKQASWYTERLAKHRPGVTEVHTTC